MLFKYQDLPELPNVQSTGNNYLDKYVGYSELYSTINPFNLVGKDSTVIACGARGMLCEEGQSDAIVLSTLAKHVVVVEAEPKNTNKIKEYIGRHNISNVSIVNKIIWNNKTELEFMCYPKSAASRVGSSRKVKTEVFETTTLNTVAKDLEKVDFIHLTVNGAELNAIHGARRMMKKFNPDFSIAFLGKNEEIFKSRVEAIRTLERAGYHIGFSIYRNQSKKNWKKSNDHPLGRLYVAIENEEITNEPIEEWTPGQYGFAVATKNKEKLIRLGFEER